MSSWAQSNVKQGDPPPLSYDQAVRYIPDDGEDLAFLAHNEWHGGYELATVYA